MPTVIATPGATDANSYTTVAEADAYFGDSFGRGLWTTASASDKEALVITASRTLDQYILWIGQKATVDQAMEWPRKGTPYASDVIPSKVKYATFELAYFTLENGGLSFAQQTVDSVKVGPVSVDFSKNSTDAGIPSFIESLIGDLGSPIIVGGSTVRMAKLERT